MAIADDIAAVEATLQSVQTAIARVQALLADDPGNTGLAATLARLEGQETELQIRLANLRAAAVTVAAVAPISAGPASARSRGARKAAAAAPAAKVAARRAGLAF